MNYSRPKKRKKKHWLLRAIIIIALIVCVYFVLHIDYFNVNGIAVAGNHDITDEEVVHLSGIEVGKRIFDVHPLIVQHKIKQNLYIESVNVNRKFPNQVEIIVEERDCRAQFVKGRHYVVTDNEGVVIDIADAETEATLVDNVTVTEAKKKKTIKVKEENVLQKALEFITITEKNDLYFKKISFDGNKISAYVYDELVCTGKYSNVVKAIRSGTLKSVIYDLYQKGTEKGTINVYGNDYCFFTP